MPPKQVKKAWTGKAPKRPRSDKEAQSDEERPPPKRRARKIKGKQAEREPTDEPTDEPTGEPAQSDEELPKKATTRAKRRQADVGQSDEAAESGETRPAKRNRKDGKAKKTSTGKEKGTGKGKAIKKKPAASVRLDPKAQILRSLRKEKVREVGTAKPFPKYGKETVTEQTETFFSTISPQVSPTEDRKVGYYPLASSMPANRGKKWNKVVIQRTCTVCGALFHEGGADGQYTEHMRLYHPDAPRSNRHG
ncbi:hypothetical protein BKA64DRAFT_702928 [Cadophora sp. MPI-SDFR-AT-0126]|nr:hypothetical protein BKA64DRAFT_702928 [Leotiomycetes sp. MPI-SDFR-AT-0126]